MSEDWRECRKLTAREVAELKRLNPCNSERLIAKESRIHGYSKIIAESNNLESMP